MSNSRNDTDQGPPHSQRTFNIDVISGLFTGVFCSGLFNPWDRALYLSVKDNRPFLSIENFRSPYHGFSQAVVQRAFLGSIYYIMQSELRCSMYPFLRNVIGMNEATAQFCIGLSAGSMSGILTNGISAVKYHTWGQEDRSFISSVREMWLLGNGFKPFQKGTAATMGRDMVFGGTYEVLRNLLYMHSSKFQHQFPQVKDDGLRLICNITAAGIATIASGPLNYVRNIQYATSPDLKPPTTREALVNVWNESKKHQQPLARFSYFQRQFRFGWGTARVALGMAVGQKVFDWTKAELSDQYSDTQKMTYKK